MFFKSHQQTLCSSNAHHYQSIYQMCGNLYFVKEVYMEGEKHFDHNIDVALCTDKFLNIQRSFKFVFFVAFFLLYIEPEMEAGGRFGERFKMRALRPFGAGGNFS